MLPIFTIEKFYEEKGILLPSSEQISHAMCEGFYLSRFYNEFQEMISKKKVF
ncbi:chloramphenicol acetyltransferase [Helicobacter sp. Faydin-H64]|uniref:Chloramphenicol acetyltransferase n=1 Tax=Helicobacter turcicus TaxID=2867412 RepID=A0ABS7JPX5_9HELI|nr:chloramphenicol acetyltransferase [Helicobacter turcicus]MBX7545903.1 chloramphenicol acetyltransferase [Helicobacter turcicus]